MRNYDLNSKGNLFRHLAKLGDLDSLEQAARRTDPAWQNAEFFEEVFYYLDKRNKIPDAVVFDWGHRYIAWLKEFPDDDGMCRTFDRMGRQAC